jgi:glycine dehydrogenase subunit 1
MMRYLPHTPEDIQEMLQVVGVGRLEDLFAPIPADCRRQSELQLPEPLTEWELNRHMDALAGTMAVAPDYKIFMGAGSYDHHIPAVCSYLLGRSEFSTSYTPYQPEISQGTLQAIFEYQTLVARLLGMEVANASMYDGASALAEALLMALRVNRGKTAVAVSRLVHPLYRRVIQTYFGPTDFEVVELPYRPDGRTDLSAVEGREDLAAVAVQSPNFFGIVEDLETIASQVHQQAALMVAAFTEPLAYALFKSPGSLGADIVCGEGQSLGLPRNFGGPGLGIFTTREKFLRSMPGRLVGQTRDRDGKRGYVLTLSTREQHIRREKATSNICTNQGLCATATTMYMASVGGSGMRALARLNRDKAEYLKAGLTAADCKIPFDCPTFNEFVAAFPAGCTDTYQRLLAKKIVAGLPLAGFYPELAGHYLLCATETSTREDLDLLVEEVKNG